MSKDGRGTLILAVIGMIVSVCLMAYSVLMLGMNLVMYSGMGSSDQGRAVGSMMFQVGLFAGAVYTLLWSMKQMRQKS